MLEITEVNISPNLPLIGKDLDAEATFNSDVSANQTDLLAGTLMIVTEGALREMVKAPALPVAALPVNQFVGILAADSYAVVPAANRPGMIYRKGTFIRSTVNEINGMASGANAGLALAPIVPGDATDVFLMGYGIHLEESYDESALG